MEASGPGTGCILLLTGEILTISLVSFGKVMYTKVGSFSQLDNNRFLYGLYIYLCMTCYETVWFGTVEVTVE